MKPIFLLTLLLAACTKSKGHVTDHVRADFDAKFKIYSKAVLEYPEFDCDWLEFQAIEDAALGKTGTVEPAEGDPGQWFRTPDHLCYPDRSNSSVSRDMIWGLALYLWQNQDATNAQEILDYAKAHDGNLGEGDPFRIGIRVSLANILTAIVARQGQQPLPPKVENPDAEASLTDPNLDDLLGQTGYQAHLTVLNIYLNGLIYAEVSSLDLLVLKHHANREPRNAFYQAVYHKYADGNMDDAIAGLMNESIFPAETLPTNENVCTDYLWQRDQGPDWEPCAKPEVMHPGVDWIFAAQIIRNGFREAKE